MRISITAGEVAMGAELSDTPTARALWEALPLEGAANVWGEEIYFGVPVEADEEPDARQVMEIGELAYWPPGKAFCIFFGPTPVSSGSEPKAYSPVNPLGMVEGDATAFKGVAGGETVQLSRVE